MPEKDEWQSIDLLEEKTDVLLWSSDEPIFCVGRFSWIEYTELEYVSTRKDKIIFKETIKQRRDWGDTPNYGAEYFLPLPEPPNTLGEK